MYLGIAALQIHAETLFCSEHYSSGMCQKAELRVEPETPNTSEIARPVTDAKI